MHVRPAPAGARPTAWQLVLWRLLAFVAHMMRPGAPDARSNMALNRYLRRHPFRGVAYGVAAWTAALLVIATVVLPATWLLERLHLRPRGAADLGRSALGLLAPTRPHPARHRLDAPTAPVIRARQPREVR